MSGWGKALIIGSLGQVGTELVTELRKKRGAENVIASDLRKGEGQPEIDGPFEVLDVMDKEVLNRITGHYQVTEIYLLAALLSATAEQKPRFAWELNMTGLFNVLDLAREKKIKLFWPSSIAVFGPGTPRVHTPQDTVMDPTTVYGISKQAGERWCEYYFLKYGVDVRSLRYPGLIGYKSAPGGGTTDYAVHIFHEALRKGLYECFLGPDTRLPMMYMPDAIRATISLMEAESSKIKVRSSYNVAGVSFTPAELAGEIARHIAGFTCSYRPDYRQAIAESWPQSIDDSTARQQWQWKPAFDLPEMTADMILHIRNAISVHP